ncbi:entericidin A/B family lipoprotein [Skermanella rosea]|uniref:entericidin A/B family lipoprotein n=1 Tax=Skermanella rosea TaxID=1817965 RepID=UPI001E3359BC|nr:entericidin A/B family lipoprotein [Skermanella rosea]UEM06148.1 entericidin A/B family lipoprotein [Skermanella rosea]
MTKLNRPDRKARPFMMAAGALALVTLLGACNTLEGFGRDTERAGEAVQDSAQ